MGPTVFNTPNLNGSGKDTLGETCHCLPDGGNQNLMFRKNLNFEHRRAIMLCFAPQSSYIYSYYINHRIMLMIK